MDSACSPVTSCGQQEWHTASRDACLEWTVKLRTDCIHWGRRWGRSLPCTAGFVPGLTPAAWTLLPVPTVSNEKILEVKHLSSHQGQSNAVQGHRGTRLQSVQPSRRYREFAPSLEARLCFCNHLMQLKVTTKREMGEAAEANAGMVTTA